MRRDQMRIEFLLGRQVVGSLPCADMEHALRLWRAVGGDAAAEFAGFRVVALEGDYVTHEV